MHVIAVVGTKKSGKTTTIENLTKELVKRGYKVAAIKHINEDFTIDTSGKDTWRYAQAGAKTIVAKGPNQIVTIQKTTQNTPLTALLKKCTGNDIVLIEGFKKTVAKNQNIPKIAITKNQTEAQHAQKTYNPIVAFTGPYNTTTLNPHIPYANAVTKPQKLTNIIEKAALKK
jgi:molybdopterin-guanine dinucleotide biosynthesis protein MobB